MTVADTVKTYLDFDLQIEAGAQGYQTQVLHSPAGQATGSFRLPFSQPQLETMLAQLGHARQSSDEATLAKDLLTAREFGWKLFNAVFGRELETTLRQSLAEADNQQTGLRIRLRLGREAKLTDLPWEYLYYPAFNSFLALAENVTLLRYLEVPAPAQAFVPPPVKLPLKILVLISNPSDYTQFDTEAEWTLLNEALGELQQQQLVTLERLEEADLDMVRQKLEQDTYHALHFIGHGGFDWQNEGLLILRDNNGQGWPLGGQALATLLQGHPSLRLAVLQGWEGVRTAGSEPFGSLAQTLVRNGLPAVVSTQFEITDSAVSSLMSEFYGALALGNPTDIALAGARQALSAQGNQIEWGNLLLCTNVSDGRIFELEPLSQSQQNQFQITTLYKAAQTAIEREEWAVAAQKLQAILELDPTQTQAVSQLAQVQRQQSWAVLYAAGLQHYTQADWREALISFRQLQTEAPAYQDVARLIADCEARLEQEHQQRITTLYAEANAAIEQKDWTTAVWKLRAILALDAAQTDAQIKLDGVRQEQLWAALYATGRAHYESERWQPALNCMLQLQAETPDYKDVPALISEIEARLAQPPAPSQALVIAAPEPAPLPLFLASAQAPGPVNYYPQQPTAQFESQGQPVQTQSQQQEWDALYAIGRHHYDNQNWQEALACFRQLQLSAGNYLDIATLIKNCEARLAPPPVPFMPLPTNQVPLSAGPAQPIAPVLPPPFTDPLPAAPRERISLWFALVLIFWTLIPLVLIIMLLLHH